MNSVFISGIMVGIGLSALLRIAYWIITGRDIPLLKSEKNKAFSVNGFNDLTTEGNKNGEIK